MKAIITTAILFCALIFSALSMTAGASEPGASNHTGQTAMERSSELAKQSIISERAYRQLLREARTLGSDRDVGTQRAVAAARPASPAVVKATPALSATDAATDRLVEQQLAALKARKSEAARTASAPSAAPKVTPGS